MAYAKPKILMPTTSKNTKFQKFGIKICQLATLLEYGDYIQFICLKVFVRHIHCLATIAFIPEHICDDMHWLNQKYVKP